MSSVATVHPFSVPCYPASPASPSGPAVDLLVTRVRDARIADENQLVLTDFADSSALHHALSQRLAQARCGLRLELRGDEAFIWPLHAVARHAGLQDDEIVLSHVQGSRLVFCVHCARYQPASPEDSLVCGHCGVHLEVRRHFSQRLGAYLGVCADAEQPFAEVRP